MSGFCGWIGDLVPPDQAPGTLEAMAHGLPQVGPCTTSDCITEGAALALRSHPRCAHWHASSQGIAAIEGYPAWSDPTLSAHAAKSGHAHTLLTEFEKQGPSLLDSLHGAFALAVLFLPSRSALLATDRFGAQPLCYSLSPHGDLVFGTTTDSIVKSGTIPSNLSHQSIFDFFYFVDRIAAPKTIYQDIGKLGPGEFAHFRSNSLEVQRYWQMPYSQVKQRPIDELHRGLREHMHAAVSEITQSESDQKIGVFLSGGLDSSTIAGLTASTAQSKPKAFTIGFDLDRYDESHYAKIAARAFDLEHEVLHLEPQRIADELPRLATFYDEPFGNSSVVPAYFCALAAKEQGVDVLMAGDGGDEIFAGNSSYLEDRRISFYNKVPRVFRKTVFEPLVRALSQNMRFSPLYKARRFLDLVNQTPAQRLFNDNIYTMMDGYGIFSRDFLSGVNTELPALQADEIFLSSDSTDPLHRMLHLDLQIILADGDLRKVNRMSELAGVRVRFPFLNDRLAHFSATVPPNELIKNGELRTFYKDAFKDFLPGEIIAKKKHGFGLPFAELLTTAGPLRDLACDCIGELRKRSLFDPRFLEHQTKQLHDRDHHEPVFAAWDLMVMELWLSSRFP